MESYQLEIQIISEVEKYPILWNSNMKAYRDKAAKDNVWLMLSHMFNMSAKDLARKWDNIRTCFVRKSNPLKSGSGASEKWPLMPYLKFLIPMVKHRSCIWANSDHTTDSQSQEQLTYDEDGEIPVETVLLESDSNSNSFASSPDTRQEASSVSTEFMNSAEIPCSRPSPPATLQETSMKPNAFMNSTEISCSRPLAAATRQEAPLMPNASMNSTEIPCSRPLVPLAPKIPSSLPPAPSTRQVASLIPNAFMNPTEIPCSRPSPIAALKPTACVNAAAIPPLVQPQNGSIPLAQQGYLIKVVSQAEEQQPKRPRMEEGRHDLFGKTIALRLCNLSKQQMLLAERLINETLFQAEMGCLTTDHKLVAPNTTQQNSQLTSNHSSMSGQIIQ